MSGLWVLWEYLFVSFDNVIECVIYIKISLYKRWGFNGGINEVLSFCYFFLEVIELFGK